MIEDFEFGETDRDENEIQEIFKFSIEGLFDKLVEEGNVSADVLLVVKMLGGEEGSMNAARSLGR